MLSSARGSVLSSFPMARRIFSGFIFRVYACCLAVAIILGIGVRADAGPAETQSALAVRDRPAFSARIIDRLPKGRRINVTGRSPDGGWSRVETAKGPGWVPSDLIASVGKVPAPSRSAKPSSPKPARPAPAARKKPTWSPNEDEGEEPTPTTKWSKGGKFKPAPSDKLEVITDRAKFYGRPQLDSPVQGTLERGEQLKLVRRSADGQWTLVDIGGGEVAWVESRDLAAPPDEAEANDNNNEEPPREPPRAAGRRGEAAENPRPAPPPRRGRGRQSADAEGDAAAPPPTPPAPKGPQKNFARIGFAIGLGLDSQKVTSNGMGMLSSYEAGTLGLAVRLYGAYERAVSRRFRLGLDGLYAFSGLGSFRVPASDGSNVDLGLQFHTIRLRVVPGLHFDVLRGLDIRVPLGFLAMVSLVQPNVKAPLPSDRILAMNIELSVDLPALFLIRDHPIGLGLAGGLIAPAERAQTTGLEEGTSSTTLGASGRVELSFGMSKHAYLEFAYHLLFDNTKYSGQAVRNTTITQAIRAALDHQITLGLSYRL